MGESENPNKMTKKHYNIQKITIVIGIITLGMQIALMLVLLHRK